MKNLQKKHLIFLLAVFLILTSLACSVLQVGVVPAADEESNQPAVEDEETAPVVNEEKSETDDQAAENAPTSLNAVAWQGHIASMPEGSQYDDVLILNPEGTGEYGLAGATAEIEAEIRDLRDGEGAQQFVHLWGSFSCGVEDVNGCQLVVDRLQSGMMMNEEEISGWTGTIRGFSFNQGSSYGLILDGPVPMAYGIYASQDPSLQAEIENLRDTGSLVRVSGTLIVSFPDVNSTRIEVSSLEVLESGELAQPTQEEFDPTADWEVFTSQRYGYRIRYPQGAELHFYGPDSFAMEDLPADMTAEEYLDSLLKEYTDQLCVEIVYSLGYVAISAPPNNSGNFPLVHCALPGYGAGELIEKERAVSIGSEAYLAKGAEFIASSPSTGETLDLHTERFMIELEDGTRIIFGSTPRPDATFEDYLMKTRDILEQIVGTYAEIQ